MLVFVAIVRGYNRELGNTIVLQVTIFLFSYFDGRIDGFLNTIGTDIFGIASTELNLFKLLFIGFLFGSIVFASYWGVTFDFPGKPLDPPSGTLVSIGIGLLNAYLIGGMLWYYLDKYQYPVQWMGVTPPTTSFAAAIIPVLPPRLFGDNVVYWVIPAALLILLRVKG
jgi:hypothetical protein